MDLSQALAGQLAPDSAARLRRVLLDFAADVRRTPGAEPVAVRLGGSFALGAADEHSDVDLVVVLERDPDEQVQEALAAMHRRRGAGDGWAGHLEVSHVGREALRGPPGDGGRWLYADNGSVDLVRSDHDDTWVTRWVLRRGGIAVAGLPAAALVPPVAPIDLRREAVAAADQRSRALQQAGPGVHDDAWLQPYLVATFCRLLLTAREGRVAGKADSMRAALRVVPADLHSLVERAIEDRADPWSRVGRPGDARSVAQMPRFVRTVASLVREVGPDG